MTDQGHSRNSRSAFKASDIEAAKARILKLMVGQTIPLSDRQIGSALGYTGNPRQCVAPAIVHLISQGRLEVKKNLKCQITGRTVRHTLAASAAPRRSVGLFFDVLEADEADVKALAKATLLAIRDAIPGHTVTGHLHVRESDKVRTVQLDPKVGIQ